MRNFREEIVQIARNRRDDYSKGKAETPSNDIETSLGEVIQMLFEQTEIGIEIFNEESDKLRLSIFKLPREVTTIFLNAPGDRVGFCLISEEKFVLFLGESPDHILVLGKKIQTKESREFVLNRAIQLIKLQYEKVGDKFSFKDNTGSVVDHKEIIIHIIKWVVT